MHCVHLRCKINPHYYCPEEHFEGSDYVCVIQKIVYMHTICQTVVHRRSWILFLLKGITLQLASICKIKKIIQVCKINVNLFTNVIN